MIVAIAANDPSVLVIIAMVIAIVVALARPGDDAPGACDRDGKQQATDDNSCCVFHGFS